MSNTQHTPGPWRWRYVVHDYKLEAILLETEHRPNPLNDPCILAIREDWLRPFKDVGTNPDARLIAACPDMLEALKEIADVCRGPAATRAELAHAVLESASAAIAKATKG